MDVQQRRKCDRDLKRDAVRLAVEAGGTVVENAEDPGLSADLLCRWSCLP